MPVTLEREPSRTRGPADLTIGLVNNMPDAALQATERQFVALLDAEPAVARSAARIVACSWVALTNVVARGLPFQSTAEAATKLVPFTVRVRPPVPALASLGDSELIVGTGFGGMLIVNVSALEVPPPGLGEKTRTAAVPAIARSAAVIAARRRVALTNVVARALPFHCTTELATKLVPFTTRVKAAPPAFALVGDSEVTVGTGLGGVLMVNVSVLEVPPPGAGVTTVTDAGPAVVRSAAVRMICSWVAPT